ncbi:MAG: hypothetical protein KF774_04075 [Planctomyces sp.]|nr:hypothetical protein [Planctomyces sp.]
MTKTITDQTATRTHRRQQLLDIWKTKEGQSRVLAMFWKAHGSERPLEAGESVIDVILDSEFGPET